MGNQTNKKGIDEQRETERWEKQTDIRTGKKQTDM
jgi:hypothetical protein